MSYENPFADAVDIYLARGWSSPIPLGRPGDVARKAPVPKGVTGRDAVVPTPEMIDEWKINFASNNIGLHAAAEQGIVMLDVDDYQTPGGKLKLGGKTIADLEAELGPLPAGPRSSARGYGVSGIRVFRVPPGLEFISKLADVEIIQAKHRYACVWPSIHPETHTVYTWYDEHGRRLKLPPLVSSVPELPKPWLEFLLTLAPKGLHKGASSTAMLAEEVTAWLAEGPQRPCRAMANVAGAEIGKLSGVGPSGSRYDTARDGAMALVRLAAEGHHGVANAVAELEAAYEAAVSDEPNRDRTEWDRLLDGAVSAVQGTEVDLHGRKCPDRESEIDPDLDLDDLWPSPNEPFDVASRFVAERHTVDGDPTIAFWRGDFYRWVGSHWTEWPMEVLKAELWRLLAGVSFMSAAATPVELKWNPNTTKIGHVLEALRAVVLFAGEDGEPGLISFANVALRLTGDGERAIVAHTPERFNLTALPFEYVPNSPEPVEWLAFLHSLFGEDHDAIRLLAQWFGYVISGDTVQQKMMLLVGPPRAGKGIIARILTALVGASNVTGPTLAQFATNFGVSPLIGKSLAIVGDARFHGTAGSVVERLLSITGEDRQTIDRKNKSAWEGKINARIMILSNELPALNESSGALSARFVGPIALTRSFLGREDLRLERRLLRELPGILSWALDGLDDLLDLGSFISPASSTHARTQLEELSEPEKAFMRECCTRRKGATTPARTLYKAFQRWSEEQGRRNIPVFPMFCRNVKAAYPELEFERTARGYAVQTRVVTGMVLKPAAIEFDLLGGAQ